MKTIVLASQKGGAGKTTLTAHLAVQAARGGLRVVLADLDPQKGLMGWWQARAAETPLAIEIVASELGAAIKRLGRRCDLLFIDTPPALGDDIRLALAHAHLVVIPVQPSPNDLRAVGATIRMAQDAGKRTLFVRNRSNPRFNIARETARVLAEYGPAAEVDIGDRTDFKSAMTDGRTAGELDPASRSAVEITQLWAEINQRIQEAV